MPSCNVARWHCYDKASVCGWQRKKRSAGGETAGTKPERTAAAEPRTEAAADVAT